MKKVRLFLFSLLLFMGACSLKEPLPREETLYVGGFQWGSAESFNPYADNPAWPVTGNVVALYETLFMYDELQGTLEPLLAKKFYLAGDSALIITLFSEAHWNDGTALTAQDVVATLNFQKKYFTNSQKSLEQLDSVYISDTNEVTVTLNSKKINPFALQDLFTSIPILPQKVLQRLEGKARHRLRSFQDTTSHTYREKMFQIIQSAKMDKNPIGSGPYVLKSYSLEKIVLQRNENYWGIGPLYKGEKPKPRYIVHLLYHSNDKYSLALQIGKIDFSRTFISMMHLKKNKGVGTWLEKPPYYVPGAIPVLVLNMGHQTEAYTPPAVLKDRVFRQALAATMKYSILAEVAMNGYSSSFQGGYILPVGVERGYYDSVKVAQNFLGNSAAMAQQILKYGGYYQAEDGLLHDPQGEVVPELVIMSPKGWSDWEIAMGIVAEGLKEIGVRTRLSFVDEATYRKNVERGFFDIAPYTYQSDGAPSLPWSRFSQTLSSENIQPIGIAVQNNVGRYHHKEVDSLLTEIPAHYGNNQALKELYTQLNLIFMQDVPVIPLLYRPSQFYQFSTKRWSNFPTENNAYAPPQSLMQGAGIRALWGIIPTKGAKK